MIDNSPAFSASFNRACYAVQPGLSEIVVHKCSYAYQLRTSAQTRTRKARSIEARTKKVVATVALALATATVTAGCTLVASTAGLSGAATGTTTTLDIVTV
jgi:hypothetical protein